MKLAFTLPSLVVACGGAAPNPPSASPAAQSAAPMSAAPGPVAPTSPTDPDPVIELACKDRIARARAHLESVNKHAQEQLNLASSGAQLATVDDVDGTDRDPKAVVIRYVPQNQGPTMIVGRDKGLVWNGHESVAKVMKLVRAHSGTKLAELELAPSMDARGLDELFVELSQWGRVRLFVMRNSFDRDRIVVPQAPSWAVNALDAGPNDRRKLIQDGMKRAIGPCGPLRDAFANMSSANDVVTKIPAALERCDCSATNPEAVATLAGLIIAVAERNLGWLDLVAKTSGGAQLTVTQNPAAVYISTDHVVRKLAELSIDVRRNGVSFSFVPAP